MQAVSHAKPNDCPQPRKPCVASLLHARAHLVARALHRLAAGKARNIGDAGDLHAASPRMACAYAVASCSEPYLPRSRESAAPLHYPWFRPVTIVTP